jgi:hypothetical protein
MSGQQTLSSTAHVVHRATNSGIRFVVDGGVRDASRDQMRIPTSIPSAPDWRMFFHKNASPMWAFHRYRLGGDTAHLADVVSLRPGAMTMIATSVPD